MTEDTQTPTEDGTETTETADTTSTDSDKKTRAKRCSNTELKFAVTVSLNGNDYVYVPEQPEHESVTAVRDALKAYVASLGAAIQQFYDSTVDAQDAQGEATLHFSVIRYLHRYAAKTETVQTTVLTEIK